jgi:Ala-tRNA(Pro) deacylase
MPVEKLKAFLDQNGVRYVSIKHSSAFTSQEVAASAHVSGKEFAKTVMIKMNDKMAMAVLPASFQIDFSLLREIFRGKELALASEAEFKGRFPDCEPGAMPPFGNLYGMEVYAEETLTADREIAFNAGSHSEIIRLSFEEYARLVQPKIFRFSWKSTSFPKDPSERWEADL